MKRNPKISIVTPAFNCADFLSQCIDSVLEQNYQNFEHIVVDGASTDGTVELLKKYSHLKWISEPDGGEAEALNKALRMANGDIIGWIGADDRYAGTEVFQHVASKAADVSGSYVIYGKGLFINEAGQTLRFHFPKNPITFPVVSRWFNGHGLFQPSMFYSKQLLDEMGEFREDLPYGIDYEFWLRISSSGRAFYYIDHILGESREGGRADSKSVMAPFEIRANEWTKISAEYQIQRSRCEQINFWKDYFVYRLNSQSQYSENIELPDQECGLLGLASALDMCNHASGIRGVYERIVQRFPACEDIYWLLASCLIRIGQSEEGDAIREELRQIIQRKDKGEFMDGRTKRDCQEVENLANMSDKNLDHECAVQSSMPENTSQGTQVKQSESLRRSNKEEAFPLVSVIIPTFNRPERLVHAVKSVLAQTYQHIEIIVINDAGCEVESILSSLTGSEKLVYLRLGRNQERSHARNMGIKISCGKYIAYLDDDDQFYPNHIETLVMFLEGSDFQVAYTDAKRTLYMKEQEHYVVKDQDVPYSIDFNNESILWQNYVPMLCLMHAKSCIEQVGGFDETLSTHEDWDLMIRLSRSFDIHHIKSVTAEFSWRTDGTSTTSQRPEDFLRTKQIIHEKYRKFWPSEVNNRVRENSHLPEKNTAISTYECSIIIPVFNKAELTQQCLAQLAKVTTGTSYEVIIVDNNSTDGTQELLESLHGDVQVIRNETNFGFAKACNQGACAARGKYFVFLNNDTIPQDGWLTHLIKEAETEQNIAIVGSKLLFADDTIQHVGVAISRNLLTPFHVYRGLPSNGKVGNQRREFQAVTAACMLVKRDWFERAERFHEGYQNGFEDTDLCLKIGELGGKIVYQPKSWMYHLESQTPGRKKYEQDNANLFIARWGEKLCVDEDLISFQDGVFLETDTTKDAIRYVYRSMKSDHEIISWKKVADLQGLLFNLQKINSEEGKTGLLKEIEALLTDMDHWPNDVEVMKWLGFMCRRFSLNQQGEVFLLRVIQSREDLDARKALAKLALARGDHRDSQNHLHVSLTYSPDDAELWNIQGVYHIQCQNFPDAVMAFERAIQHGGDLKKAQIGLGMAYVGAGKIKHAWNTFKVVWEQNPDDVEVMNWLLRVGTELADWNALSTCLTKFVERNPANCDMRFALAGTQVRCGNRENAQSNLQTLRLLKPDQEGFQDLEHAIVNMVVNLKAAANS